MFLPLRFRLFSWSTAINPHDPPLLSYLRWCSRCCISEGPWGRPDCDWHWGIQKQIAIGKDKIINVNQVIRCNKSLPSDNDNGWVLTNNEERRTKYIIEVNQVLSSALKCAWQSFIPGWHSAMTGDATTIAMVAKKRLFYNVQQNDQTMNGL